MENTTYTTTTETEIEANDTYVRWRIEAEEKFASEEEARDYIRLAQRGNEKALESIVRKQLPMIAYYARQYARRGSCFDDLHSEGMMAIMNAVRKFDLKNSVSVGTVFITAIRTAMRRYCGEDRTVKIAINANEDKVKLHAVIERMKAEEKELTIEAIAEEAHMKKSKVEKLIAIELGVDSMNIRAEGKDGDGDEMGDSIAIEAPNPSEEAERNDSIAKVLSELKNLAEIEKLVIEYRFGINGKETKTYAEIAELTNRTAEGIRQIEMRSLRKIREACKGN